MNILMCTNTYYPHVGGVAKSVRAFEARYRERGHEVLVIAPEFPKTPASEEHVIRLPAIQNFNGSDFSVRLPLPVWPLERISHFGPAVVHAHHPFLLGDTALRIGAHRNLPVVFTHHTMYEQYTHYVPGDSPAMRRFVIDLSTGFANLCEAVIAPSQSIADILRERGVRTRVEVIPTGVDVEHFGSGDGTRLRSQQNIPAEATVIGHLGRLAPEKNLDFLARAVARVLHERSDAHFLVVGAGPSQGDIERHCVAAGVDERLHFTGKLTGQDLVDAYHAMDVFAFASKSETQGMVLVEAMAAGLPVVAIDAPGAREVVADQRNGRLLRDDDEAAFAGALNGLLDEEGGTHDRMRHAARETAEELSIDNCAERALALYSEVVEADRISKSQSDWDRLLQVLGQEWELWRARAHAAGQALPDFGTQGK